MRVRDIRREIIMVGDERGAATAGRTWFFQGVGTRLRAFAVDVDSATLTPRDAVDLPSNIQYAWPHPSRPIVYVATSDSASGNATVPGVVHRLCAVCVDTDGRLVLHGEPQVLPTRPIHASVDRSGGWILTAYNKPSGLTVHAINPDGTVGAVVPQSAALDAGVFAHQILALPSNRSIVLVARGNDAVGDRREDPGALKTFGFADGKLSPGASIAAGDRGGLGYGPRHLDFHPVRPWVYVSVERQNALHMHRMQGDRIDPQPAYVKGTLAMQRDERLMQVAGGIHVHPAGGAVYVSNRASTTETVDGRPVLAGGENSIAVFAIDAATGEPTLIQHADPRSCHVRTFSVDPTGHLFVAASIMDVLVRDGPRVRYVPAALSVFRIAAGGRLDFVRKLDVDLGGNLQWWTGFVRFPPPAGSGRITR
jgi:6-phosphogluconolactonase (cycloisomerase 2 family)